MEGFGSQYCPARDQWCQVRWGGPLLVKLCSSQLGSSSGPGVSSSTLFLWVEHEE